jgi:hypothetical protein
MCGEEQEISPSIGELSEEFENGSKNKKHVVKADLKDTQVVNN